MARFSINNTNFGIYQDGNVNCSNVFKSNIINNLDNKVNLIKSGGEVGSIFIGQKYISSSNIGNIPILKATRNTNGWGACYCEFIICGTHTGLNGFVRKCEFMMTTGENTAIQIFQNSVSPTITGLSDGVEISSTTIGKVASSVEMPKITQSPSGTGANAYMTFYVVPPNTNSTICNVFFRIMTGSETTYTYTIL
jgi:hypothetical protein